MNSQLPGLLVVGTDTDVGKTQVAVWVVRSLRLEGHRVGVLKPVATGTTLVSGKLHCDDADRLLRASGCQEGMVVSRERVAPLVFEAPVAPPVSARLEGKPLEFKEVKASVREAVAWWSESGQVQGMIIEGVGGLLCPLAEHATVADLAVVLDYPVLIVARGGLGTLNHILLTVESALSRGLRIAGIVLNETKPAPETLAEQTNALELARRLAGIPILAEIRYQSDLEAIPRELQEIDWIGRMKIARCYEDSLLLVSPLVPHAAEGGSKRS